MLPHYVSFGQKAQRAIREAYEDAHAGSNHREWALDHHFSSLKQFMELSHSSMFSSTKNPVFPEFPASANIPDPVGIAEIR